MAHENKVIRSVNLSGELKCVDVFRRPDGSFGSDEFRRDPEDDVRGWYSTGHYGGVRFDTADVAWVQALTRVQWLSSTMI